MRWLTFEIPNKYGKYLFDILNAFDFKQYVGKLVVKMLLIL